MAGDDLKSRLDALLPQGYYGTLDSAAENLGQTEDRNNVSASRQKDRNDSVNNLINGYVDRVYSKTGAVPTEDQVRKFVNDNYTQGYANKFTLKQISPDSINSMVDEHLNQNPVGTQGNPDEQRILGLTGQLNKLYDTGKESLVKGYDQSVYGPAKTNTTNDLAGQGLLTQPTSRYALDAIDANRGRDLTSGLNTLESQRAQGNIDISKTIEDLLQRNKDRAQNEYQFGKTFGANRDDAAYNQAMQGRSMDIAAQIGRLQAGQKKNNGLTAGLGGAASGAATGALTGSVVPGIGTGLGALIGGIGGGLGGFLSSRS